MGGLVTLLITADKLADKFKYAVIEKTNIDASASVQQTTINANKDKYIAGLTVTGAVIITGMITNTISKRKVDA